MRTDLFEFAVDIQAFYQFVPVVGRVLDARIDEKMEHLQFELLVVLYLAFVVIHYVVVTDTKTRGVEVKLGFLLRGDPDADLAFVVEYVGEQVDLFLVVQNGDRVFEAVVDQSGDVFHILGTFESVADDITVLVDDAAVVQGVYDVDVVGAGALECDLLGRAGRISVRSAPPE